MGKYKPLAFICCNYAKDDFVIPKFFSSNFELSES